MRKKLFLMLLLLTGVLPLQAVHHIGKEISGKSFKTPVNVMVSNVGMTSADVSWDPVSGATSYNVRWRVVGSPVWVAAVISSGVATYQITSLIPCTAYEVQVADGITPFSNSVFFYTGLNYCSAGSTDTSVMHISNVTVVPYGGTPQMNSSSGPSGYTDYRHDSSRRIQLAAGSPVNTIAVTLGWTAPQNTVYVTAWIDFNANGVFESSERIMVESVNSSTPTVSSFAVPSLASITQCGVAMRVMASSTVPTGSCGTFMYGEVEDYGVNIVNGTLSVSESAQSKEPGIYPNPASDLLNIQGLSSDAATYEIFTAAGQKADEGKVSGNTVNISKLIKGVYFLQLKTKDQTIRLKFIKK
ncbi:MAG: GEVED domain-containing protein [Chryseobacterium sp.]|jgi:hypothetical protein|uniref:GEVED domain-containing protein n=1 Tax=Chryseobacterium sp. TaxID=1871047 RepID=UPI002826E29E|nr:GEVED domain-containing protein [Chryseobacterium sp.]MDR2238544.1 GEVED domain-containing protein [Chryseobacterium sp.]